MKKAHSLAIGSLAAGVLAYCLVDAFTHLGDDRMTVWIFQGIEKGWQVLTSAGRDDVSSVAALGRLLAFAIRLACPLCGFFVFSVLRGRLVTTKMKEPLAIALCFCSPLQLLIRQPLVAFGLTMPEAEAIGALLVTALMASNSENPVWVRFIRLFRKSVLVS